MRYLFIVSISLFLFSCQSVPTRIPQSSGSDNPWIKIATGIEFREFALQPSAPDDALLYDDPTGLAESRAEDTLKVIRITPSEAELVLLAQSEMKKPQRLRVSELMIESELIVGTNASLYASDNMTSTGYMRNGKHINNGKFMASYNAIFVFNPKEKNLPLAQIIEKDQPKWKETVAQYATAIEDYRMISRDHKNQWKSGQAFYYRVSLLGMDKTGHVLFIFCPRAYTMYSLNQFLLTLPLDIDNLMYLDGESKSGLWMQQDNGIKSFGYDDFLPNIVGVKKRQP